MKRNLTIIYIMCLAAVFLIFAPVTVQGGGKGGGKPGGNGGDPTEIHSPVIIGHGNVAGFHPDYPWSSIHRGNHPQQLRPEDGSERAHIHSVSLFGDLSHGGPPRFVLDVREDANGPNCLIAAVEGVYDDDNPTWWYVPTEDDVIDRVLLYGTDYDVGSAKWSPDLSRVAFTGQDLSTGESGIFLGDVGFDVDDHPNSLSNLFLAVPDVGGVSWGSSTRFCYYQIHATGTIWYADLSQDPYNPVLTPIPITGDYPAMSFDGNRVCYVRDVPSTSRKDIFYWNIALYQEFQVTNKSRFRDLADGIYNPSWSPDGQQLCFAVRDWSSGLFAYVYRIVVEGNSKAVKLTTKKTVKGVATGALGVGMWRE